MKNLIKEKYIKLKSKSIKDLYSNFLRGLQTDFKYQLENKESYIVSYFFLGLKYKELEGLEELENYVKSIEDETLRNFLKEIIKDLESKNHLEKLLAELKGIDSEDLEALIVFPIYERSYIKDSSTPEGICKLVLSLLEINEDDKLLDLGSGINEFLIQAQIQKNLKFLKGVELNVDNYIIGKLRMEILGIEADLKVGNALDLFQGNNQVNKVFSNPPVRLAWPTLSRQIEENEILKEYFEGSSRNVSSEWAFAIAAMYATGKGGRSAVIMSNSGSWNKSDTFIREELLKLGKIEGVIQLAENLFECTGISFTIFIFSDDNKDVRMIDASECFTAGRSINSLEDSDIEKILKAYKSDTSISRTVAMKEIKANEYILNPSRYTGEEIEIRNPIKLGEIVHAINRGSMITKKELDKLASNSETQYRHLMLSNISNGEIDKNLPYLKIIDEKDEKYCLKNGNLIISKIAPYKVALAELEECQKILATGNLYMIEVDKKKVNPIYLELFLRSELGLTQLTRLSKGAVMKSISIQDLKNVKIPNISLEEQNKIAEEVRAIDAHILSLEKQIKVLKEEKGNLLKEAR